MLGIGNAMINQLTRTNLPDHQLFTFLDAEGAAVERDKMGPAYVKFDNNPPQAQRRAKMTPEQRSTLEFLEEAKDKLDEIDRPARPQRIDGRSVAARFQYLNSLPADKRTLLEKVMKEGAYPFTRPQNLLRKGSDVFIPRRSEPGAEAITDMRNLARRGLTASSGWLR